MIFLNKVCTVLEPNISNLDKDEDEEDVELVIGLNDYDNFEEEEDKKMEEKVGVKCKKTPVKPDVYKEDVTTIHVPTQAGVDILQKEEDFFRGILGVLFGRIPSFW